MAKTPGIERDRREAPRTGGKTVPSLPRTEGKVLPMRPRSRHSDDLEFSIYNPWAKKSEAISWQSMFGYLVPDLDLDPPSGENGSTQPQPQDPSNDDTEESPQSPPEYQDRPRSEDLGEEEDDGDPLGSDDDQGDSDDRTPLADDDGEDSDHDGGEDSSEEDPSESDGVGTETEGESSDSGDSGDPRSSDSNSDRNDNDPDDESQDQDPSLTSVDPQSFGFSSPTDQPITLPGFYYAGATAEADEEFIREFTSWSDFVSTACDPGLYAWQESKEQYSHKISHHTDTWSGTRTFSEAEELARWRGWPEGRELLRDSLASVVPHQKPIPAYELDMAGAFPIVPVYCAGDPACMMNIETQTDRFSRPIIRIDFNNYVMARIEPTTIMNRGAAVLSLANTLEMMGYSTELRIIGNARSRQDGRGTDWRTPKAKQIFRYNIIYKQAGEILDLDRAAFALAHPATMRRLVFALLEQHKDLEYTFGAQNYGLIMSQPNDPTSGKPGGAIFVPCPPSNESREESQAAVEAAAEAIINQLFKEAA